MQRVPKVAVHRCVDGDVEIAGLFASRSWHSPCFAEPHTLDAWWNLVQRGGRHDHRKVATTRVVRQVLQHLDSGHPRHQEVEDDEAELEDEVGAQRRKAFSLCGRERVSGLATHSW